MKRTGRAVVSDAMVSIHKRTFKVLAAKDQTTVAAASARKFLYRPPITIVNRAVTPLARMRRVSAQPDASNAECLVRCDT